MEHTLARPGGLSYLEIPASDPSRSATFYERVLGWTIDRRGPDDYRYRDQTGHLIGRWVKGSATSDDKGLLPYFYVDRIEDAVQRVVDDGGNVVRAPYPEGDLLVTLIRDPAGNLIGLWQQV